MDANKINSRFGQVVAVVLAAGAARRFGRPKQLERWPDQTSPALIQRAIGLTLKAGIQRVYVVIGNQREKMLNLIMENPYSVALPIYNPRWEEGQGFSVAVGVKEVQTSVPQAQAILFMLADQPRLQQSTLTKLLVAFNSLEDRGQNAILFPTYGGKRGNPVIFGRAFFEELTKLEGDVGGRAIVKTHPTAVIEVPVDDPAIHEDVDRPEDLERLSST